MKFDVTYSVSKLHTEFLYWYPKCLYYMFHSVMVNTNHNAHWVSIGDGYFIAYQEQLGRSTVKHSGDKKPPL